MNLDLITMVFDEENTATDAYKGVLTLQTDGTLDIIDTATVVKRRDELTSVSA